MILRAPKSLFGLGLLALAVSLPGVVNAEAGRDLYETKCGSCHADGGSAAVIRPGDKAIRQWERYFERGRHKRKADISAVFTAEELAEVLQYLVAHAADADKAIAAGLR